MARRIACAARTVDPCSASFTNRIRDGLARSAEARRPNTLLTMVSRTHTGTPTHRSAHRIAETLIIVDESVEPEPSSSSGAVMPSPERTPSEIARRCDRPPTSVEWSARSLWLAHTLDGSKPSAKIRVAFGPRSARRAGALQSRPSPSPAVQRGNDAGRAALHRTRRPSPTLAPQPECHHIPLQLRTCSPGSRNGSR